MSGDVVSPGTDKVLVEHRFDAQVLDLKLNAPKGNVLDGEMMSGLTRVLNAHGGTGSLKAIVFRGEGRHFSFGASVEEHTRDRVSYMLEVFHGMLRSLVASGRPTFAVVGGQCLGGGLELAATCHWIFSSPDARFGQPEINLGVFPPAASVMLPYRIGQSAADDLILTGRSIDAEEARRIGLVHTIADDPSAALDEFLEKQILPKSAAALSHAVRASRFRMNRKALEDLDQVEQMYVDELMATHDANEGIEAFLEKRDPVWRDR